VKRLIAALTIAVSALAACSSAGGDDSGAGSADSSSARSLSADPSKPAAPAQTSTPSLPSLPNSKVEFTFGVTAQQIADKSGCTGAVAKSTGPADVNIGPTPAETVECMLDGAQIEIDTWANQGDEDTALALGEALAATFGSFAAAVGDGWSASLAITDGSGVDSALQLKIAQTFVGSCGGRVISVAGPTVSVS
jgi:hypothetical protein